MSTNHIVGQAENGRWRTGYMLGSLTPEPHWHSGDYRTEKKALAALSRIEGWTMKGHREVTEQDKKNGAKWARLHRIIVGASTLAFWIALWLTISTWLATITTSC